MISTTSIASRRIQALVGLLDIPDSHYQLATERYQSVSDWLHRGESTVVRYEPAIYPQGSFRYGTVNRPLFKKDEYDLDAVVELLLLTKGDQSQLQLKQMLGAELRAYAIAKQFRSLPEEKKRCWRLDYADQIKFHMDVLPAIPEDPEFKQGLIRIGVDTELAMWAIAITDTRDRGYGVIQRNWPHSSPKGFAKWFEGRMRGQAELQLKGLLQARALASIDEIPAWEWKTPLQRAIQILKRHRDVTFKDHCELAPISMIITLLAAQAYEGQEDLYEALSGILERMPEFVRSGAPRIPNPVNPAEDFADRWKSDSRLEPSFWKWHTRATADFRELASQLNAKEVYDFAQSNLRIELDETTARTLANAAKIAPIAAPIIIASAPKPWGS